MHTEYEAQKRIEELFLHLRRRLTWESGRKSARTLHRAKLPMHTFGIAILLAWVVILIAAFSGAPADTEFNGSVTASFSVDSD